MCKTGLADGLLCKSTLLVLRNSIQEKDNAEKSPFIKLFLLLINRELSVKGVSLLSGFLYKIEIAVLLIFI